MRAPVNRIVPFSSVDGPGNRTAVFLQGCNFNCRYCHNPETIRVCTRCGACVSVCPAGALRIEDGEVRYDWAKCKMCDACIHSCPHSSCPRIRNLSDEECTARNRKADSVYPRRDRFPAANARCIAIFWSRFQGAFARTDSVFCSIVTEITIFPQTANC